MFAPQMFATIVQFQALYGEQFDSCGTTAGNHGA
jgi:hypothetical protein